MTDFLVFLQDVDLGRYLVQLGQFVNHADPWLLGIIVSVLVGIGHKLAIGNRLVYGWGLRLAALTFLVHFGAAMIQAGGLEQMPTSMALTRSGIVAGAVLALLWILLPVVLFVYGNFRFGLAGFAGYCGYGLLMAESIETETLPGICLRGLLVAGLAMVLAWILRPVWEFGAAIWLTHKPAALPVPVRTNDPTPAPTSELSRRERRRRRLTRLLALQAAAPLDLAGLSPQDSETRRRREKARLDLELAYLLATPQLGSHFPRAVFDGWVVRYLGNHLPAEEVEENSWHMQKALRQYHQQADGGNSNLNLEELHTWFLDEQRRIQSLHLDPAARQEKLLALQELYVSLSQRMVVEPPGAIVQMVAPRPVDLALPQAVAAQ